MTAAALIGALSLTAGCSGPVDRDDDATARSSTASADDRLTDVAVAVGPQGDRGQFVVECGFDRFLADDPIVHPGRPGASHLHQFFGAVGVSVESTHDDLLASDTTCDQPADTASYWSPVLLDPDGEPIEPLGSVAYYRVADGVEPTDVIPFPPGLMMVAGDHTALDPQPRSVVAWSCGPGAVRTVRPSACGPASPLRVWITFPDCWNGLDTRSPIVVEPSRHVGYSVDGSCPDEHPMHLPQLQFAIDYPAIAAADVDELAWSSGAITTTHADFWNVWRQDKLRREVVHCLHRQLPCGIAG